MSKTTTQGWPWRLRHAFGDFYVLVDNCEQYIGSACVEGHADEWRGMAEALRSGGSYHAKRCAVEFEDGAALFWSPRNTTSIKRGAGRLPQALAAELADAIDAGLAQLAVDDV